MRDRQLRWSWTGGVGRYTGGAVRPGSAIRFAFCCFVAIPIRSFTRSILTGYRKCNPLDGICPEVVDLLRNNQGLFRGRSLVDFPTY
jgi:hypothetical protein